MAYTVTRDGGTKDAEFEAYARLLRQQGVDLGKVPRVLGSRAQHSCASKPISLFITVKVFDIFL